MRSARCRSHSGRRGEIQRSVGDLSTFRPYLGEGGERGRKRDWRIAAVFFVVALLLTYLPSTYREGLARGVRATVLRPVLALQQGAGERQALFADPVQLRAERDSLAAFLVGQAGISAENRQLRELLGLSERIPRSFVPAELVRIPGRGSEGYFELTAGSDQGIRAGASIVAAQGLVGRVREVDRGIGFGIDWMNSDFRASAMTVDGEVYGILEPRRVGGEPLLVLTGTPRHVELEPNTMIVTSGHGGVFPRGIPIGTVLGQEGGEAEWQRNYLVQPLVSPAEMAYVLVLGEPEPEMQGRDLALAWGIRPAEADPEAAEAAEAAAEFGGVGPGGAGTAPPAASAPEQQPAEDEAPTPTTEPEQPEGPALLGDPVQPQ
ncbi:MAG: rod shape-determining protein MreC [Gemmatimonadota bacterium]